MISLFQGATETSPIWHDWWLPDQWRHTECLIKVGENINTYFSNLLILDIYHVY